MIIIRKNEFPWGDECEEIVVCDICEAEIKTGKIDAVEPTDAIYLSGGQIQCIGNWAYFDNHSFHVCSTCVKKLKRAIKEIIVKED